jgi:sugar lactone lactonase YvrE
MIEPSPAQLTGGTLYPYESSLSTPTSVAVDSSGNVWVADSNAGTLLENGSPVNPDDTLQWPYQLAIDGSDNVYVNDEEVGTIYEISGNTITDLTPDLGISEGIAVGPTGTLYAQAGGAIYEYESGWTTFYDGYDLDEAGLGLAVDSSGNVYVAEYCEIQKITPGLTVTTVAGTGTCGASTFSDGAAPTDAAMDYGGEQGLQIAFDGSDNLFIADGGNQEVFEVFASDGRIYHVAGDGSSGAACDGTSLAISSAIRPFGVGLDSSGVLYIADAGDNKVCKVY